MKTSLVPASSLPALLDRVAHSVRSPATARAYLADLQDWAAWCAWADEDPTFPIYRTVIAYIHHLAEAGAAKTTIRRRVSALRKLARVAAVADFGNPARQAALESLSPDLLQVTVGHTDERDRKALKPAQVERALSAWEPDTLLGLRNRAIVAVAFCTGARRSEIAVMRWANVDLDEGVVHIPHGKGDKARHVPLYGERALAAVRAWRRALGDGREYVFPRMHKGDVVGDDAPITADGIYYVIQETAKRSGEAFTPHDARRTLITEALATGTPLADVQADAGHAQGSTTLRYAQATDARERRRRSRLRYG